MNVKKRLTAAVSLILTVVLFISCAVAGEPSVKGNGYRFSDDSTLVVVNIAADEQSDTDYLKAEREAAAFAACRILEMGSETRNRYIFRADGAAEKNIDFSKINDAVTKKIFQPNNDNQLAKSSFDKIGAGIKDLDQVVQDEQLLDLWFVVTKPQATWNDNETRAKIGGWLGNKPELTIHYIVLTDEDLTDQLTAGTVIGMTAEDYPERVEIIQLNPKTDAETVYPCLSRDEWYTAMDGSYIRLPQGEDHRGQPAFEMKQDGLVLVTAYQERPFTVLTTAQSFSEPDDPSSSALLGNLQTVTVKLKAGQYYLYDLAQKGVETLEIWLLPQDQTPEIITENAEWNRVAQSLTVRLPLTYGLDSQLFTLNIKAYMLDAQGNVIATEEPESMSPTVTAEYGLEWLFEGITPPAECYSVELKAEAQLKDQDGRNVIAWNGEKTIKVTESQIAAKDISTEISTYYYDSTGKYESRMSWPITDIFEFEEADLNQIDFNVSEDSGVTYSKDERAFILDFYTLPEVIRPDADGNWSVQVTAKVRDGETTEANDEADDIMAETAVPEQEENLETETENGIPEETNVPTEEDFAAEEETDITTELAENAADEAAETEIPEQTEITTELADAQDDNAVENTIHVHFVPVQSLLTEQVWKDRNVWNAVRETIPDVPTPEGMFREATEGTEQKVEVLTETQWTRRENTFTVTFEDTFGIDSELLEAQITITHLDAAGTPYVGETGNIPGREGSFTWSGKVTPTSLDRKIKIEATIVLTGAKDLSWTNETEIDIVTDDVTVKTEMQESYTFYYDAEGKYPSSWRIPLDELFVFSEEDKDQLEPVCICESALDGLTWAFTDDTRLVIRADEMKDDANGQPVTVHVTLGNASTQFTLEPVPVQSLVDLTVTQSEPADTETVPVGQVITLQVSIDNISEEWSEASEIIPDLPALTDLVIRLTVDGETQEQPMTYFGSNEDGIYTATINYSVPTDKEDSEQFVLAVTVNGTDGWKVKDEESAHQFVAVNNAPEAQYTQKEDTESIGIEGSERIPVENLLEKLLGTDVPAEMFNGESGENLKYFLIFDGDAVVTVCQNGQTLTAGEEWPLQPDQPIEVTVQREKAEQPTDASDNKGYGLKMTVKAEDEAGQSTELTVCTDFYSEFEKLILTIAIIAGAVIILGIAAFITVRKLSEVAFSGQRIKCAAAGDKESAKELISQQNGFDMVRFGKQEVTLLQMMILQKQPSLPQVEASVLTDIHICAGKNQTLRIQLGKKAREIYAGLDKKIVLEMNKELYLDYGNSRIYIQNAVSDMSIQSDFSAGDF